MREFVVLFIENVLKQLPKKILDEKTFFFHLTILGEVIHWTLNVRHILSVANYKLLQLNIVCEGLIQHSNLEIEFSHQILKFHFTSHHSQDDMWHFFTKIDLIYAKSDLHIG